MSKNISAPSKGLVTDPSYKNQPKGTYPFALNAINESDSGDNGYIGNEEGNSPCHTFVANYTPIGKVYIGNGETLIFLVDTNTNTFSKIGIASAGCVFTEIVSDVTQTDKLGFSIEYQIDATYRLRKGCERMVYFTDGLNKPRQINLDNLDVYKDGSGDWVADKFDLIKNVTSYPNMATSMGNSGNLLPGSYNVGIALLDEDLNSTEVLTTTNIINVYNDKEDQDYSSINGSTTEESSYYSYNNTNKSIIVETSNLDENYKYYRLFLISANSSSGEISEVTFTDEILIGQNTFELTGDNTPYATSIDEVLINKLHLSSAEHIEQIDNRLILANTKGTTRDLCALQASASAIKSDLVLTNISLNNIKGGGNPKRGEILTNNNAGYMPGEIYPFGIVYAFPDGLSPAMHIPGRNAADTSDMSSDNECVNLTYTEDSCNSGFWGDDYNGSALLGEKVRHHRFPYRHEINEPLYDKDQTLDPTNQYKHGGWVHVEGLYNQSYQGETEYDGNIYLKITYELNSVVTEQIISFEDTYTHQNEYVSLYINLNEYIDSSSSGYVDTGSLGTGIADSEVEFVWADGSSISLSINEPLRGSRGSGDDYGTTKWVVNSEFEDEAFLKEVNDYTTNILGISFSNIILPADCLGYYIVRMERKDSDKTILDSAIMTPLMESSFYTAHAQLTPIGAATSESHYAFISPEFKFKGKEFSVFDDIVCEGLYSVADKEENEKITQDVYAGTSYDSTIAKRREKDTDGFSLHTYSRFSKLDLETPTTIAATPDEVLYLASLSSTTSDGVSIFNASGDNRIGVVKTDVRIPDINTDRKIPYVVFKRNIPDPYPLFRSGTYYREHTELRTVSTANIFNGDTHVTSMTYTNSLFYDLRLRNRASKSGVWTIIGGSLLVALGTALAILSSGVAAGLGAPLISAGLSALSSGISQSKIKRVYQDEYEKGLSETIKDNDSIAVFGGNPVDDEIQYLHDTLGDVFFESTVNMGIRVEPNFGPQFFQPSPRPYDPSSVIDYCVDKVSEVDTENENGRLYRGFPLAEVYKINKDYLRRNHEKRFFPLSVNAQCCTDCPETFKNRIHWSTQSFQEEQTDNYGSFAPLDYRDVAGETGPISDLFKIQNNLYIHTEEGLWHLPQNIQERITGDIVSFIGTGSYFSIPPRKVVDDDTGISSGSKHKWGTIKTPHGVFFVCESQGGIFHFNGNNLIPISANGNYNWFKNNLPFDITDYTGLVDNNPSNTSGIGFISTYDARHERVIFTKKAVKQKITHYLEYPEETDYLVEPIGDEYWMFRDYQATIDLKVSEGFVYQGIVYGGIPPAHMLFIKSEEGEPDIHFKYLPEQVTPVYGSYDGSWTISYSLKNKSWVSWHSYLPNFYYHNSEEFFSWLAGQSLNAGWKHNIIGKYQNFYGNKVPFIIEPVSNSGPIKKKTWEDISFITEASKYNLQKEEFYEERFVTFTKAILYNTRQSTGELTLKVKNTNVATADYLSQQVENVALNEIVIDRTEKDWFMNMLRDIRTDYEAPIFNSDPADLVGDYYIDKIINTSALDLNKPWHELESFKDSYLVIRFIFDTFEDIKLILNYSIENEIESFK